MSQIEGKPLGNGICSSRLSIRVCLQSKEKRKEEREKEKRNITLF